MSDSRSNQAGQAGMAILIIVVLLGVLLLGVGGLAWRRVRAVQDERRMAEEVRNQEQVARQRAEAATRIAEELRNNENVQREQAEVVNAAADTVPAGANQLGPPNDRSAHADKAGTPDVESRVDTSSTRMLAPEVAEEIATLVRCACYEKERLLEIFCEEMYEPGELERATVSAAIDTELAQWESEKQTWPSVTDCDRLDSAFAAICARGIIALQNAGNTQSDGYEDFRETYEQHSNKSSVVGYCFYHLQDLERAVRGGGLSLAFGPVDPNDEPTEGPEIGRIICDELERAGLQVDWDGSFAKRINIPNLVWQRR